MSPVSTIRRALVAGSVLAVVGGLAISSPAAAATSTSYAHGGSAYGSSAKLGSLINSGGTAAVSMCTTSATTKSNNVAATKLGPAGSIGAVTTSLTGTRTSSKQTTVATSKTGAVSLLGGVIKADAITTRSTVEHTSSGYRSSGSSTFTGLRIGGIAVSASPAKNTTLKLPLGLGQVILNRQTVYNGSGRYQIATDALYVKVSAGSSLGLPSGTIVVGRTNALLHTPIHARPYGSAWATKATLLGGIASSGATAVVNLPCGGANGRTLTNSTAAVSVPNALKVGAVSSSGTSTDSSTLTSATTSSTVAGVSLLNGVVKLDGLTVKASAVQKPGQPLSRSSAGTKITGLTINGRPVSVTVRENTKINIAGLGTLWLHKTVRTGTRINVYGVQLELLNDKSGLKAGSVITIGGVSAGVAPN